MICGFQNIVDCASMEPSSGLTTASNAGESPIDSLREGRPGNQAENLGEKPDPRPRAVRYQRSKIGMS